MVMARAVVAGAADAAAAAFLALTTARAQHDRLGEECDAVVPPAPQECVVCLCELAGAAGCGEPEASPEAAAVRTLPLCGHGFHAECIGRWLPLRAECPICRRPVVTADAPAVAVAEAAAAAPAWSRPARMACGFGDGRVVWTRSPSPQEL